jgi:hypothetical protein
MSVFLFRTSSLQRREAGGASGQSAYERLFGRPPQHVTGSANPASGKKTGNGSSAASGKKTPVFITKAGRRREKERRSYFYYKSFFKSA